MERIDVRDDLKFPSMTLGTLKNEIDVEIVDQQISSMKLRLWGHVWGERVIERSAKYPKDWWQAFRERWFPKKWLYKHPVEYEEVHMTGYEIHDLATPLSHSNKQTQYIMMKNDQRL